MLATDQNGDTRGLSSTSIAFLAMRDEVLTCWELQVRARVPAASAVSSPVLTNTLPAFYDNIAEALTPSYPRDIATSHTNAAAVHGGERARMTPFGPDQIIEEYQIFRETVYLVARARLTLTEHDHGVIDDSINAAVLEAVRAFMAIHDDLRLRLAASLSHDMRTPLSIMLSGAELIKLAPDLAAAQRAGAKIETSAHRMIGMMNELVDALTYKNRNQLVLSLSAFDIQDVIAPLVQDFNDSGMGDFELLGRPVAGHWCRNALLRLFENLMTNASKYGDGGRVRIETSEIRGRLVVTVHNTGVHIPKEQQTRIFEYLERMAGGDDAAGWGIGLQLVKQVAASHGGSVAVDSSSESGTTFIVDIPVDSRPFVN